MTVFSFKFCQSLRHNYLIFLGKWRRNYFFNTVHHSLVHICCFVFSHLRQQFTYKILGPNLTGAFLFLHFNQSFLSCLWLVCKLVRIYFIGNTRLCLQLLFGVWNIIIVWSKFVPNYTVLLNTRFNNRIIFFSVTYFVSYTIWSA